MRHKFYFLVVLNLLAAVNAKSQFQWDSVGSGVDAAVKILVTDSTNDILYLGGDFGTINNSTTAYHFAIWDNVSYNKLSCGNDFYGSPITGCIYNNNFTCGGDMIWYDNICGGLDIYTKMQYIYSSNSWDSLGTEWGVSAMAMTLFQGKLAIGGRINTVTGQNGYFNANNICLWNGSFWEVLGGNGNYGLTMVSAPLVPWVWDMITFNNELYVSGVFDHSGGVTLNHPGMAKWNGTQWSDAGVNGIPFNGKFAIFQGELYCAAGQYLYKLDNGNWSLISTAANPGIIFELLEWNGQLIITGQFTSIDGVSASGIAAWNGVQWSPLGSGIVCNNGTGPCATPNSGIGYTLAVYNNELYVGGYFTHAGGIPANNIARYRITASLATNTINSLTVFFNSPQSILTIGNGEDVFSGTIYSSDGRKCLSFNRQNTVSIPWLVPGMYIVRLENDFGYYLSKKFVVH